MKKEKKSATGLVVSDPVAEAFGDCTAEPPISRRATAAPAHIRAEPAGVSPESNHARRPEPTPASVAAGSATITCAGALTRSDDVSAVRAESVSAATAAVTSPVVSPEIVGETELRIVADDRAPEAAVVAAGLG